MADIHQQHDAAQYRPRQQIAPQQRLPVRAHLLRHLGIAIARQINEIAARLRQGEIVNELRPPRCARYPRQRLLVGERIERARFARVGASGEGNFNAGIGASCVSRLAEKAKAACW